MTRKTLGRPPGSLNAPIAAFTMAIVLCSYCFSSIRSARREATTTTTTATTTTTTTGYPNREKESGPSWVQQALDQQREVEQRKEKKR